MNARMVEDPISPNGGSVHERRELNARFVGRVSVNENFSRRVVSWQGNRSTPGLRWMRYKEGFSGLFVSDFIDRQRPQAVLDPFAGIGTTPLAAAGTGAFAKGIEIMPVGVQVGTAIAEAANGLALSDFERNGAALVKSIRGQRCGNDHFRFPHVRITERAFSKETEDDIANAREFLDGVTSPGIRTVLDLACMSILEETSFTRKDGQYLRWDGRSGRPLRSAINKGHVPSFADALEKRIAEICEDAGILKEKYGGAKPDLVTGSCLELLKEVPDGTFDLVVTSPPYANRYDYTRTYALELAWMGFDRESFSSLRQRMLSATVENRPKSTWLEGVYMDAPETLRRARRMHRTQGALQEVISILRERESELSNRNVLRLIEQYFLEMAIVISELGRIVRPGGTVIMVNDNVQYHGEEVPVDFILSDFAEQSGFRCADIWKLARGKGNSSQQMARYGRRELRKCVYRWTRANDQ